LYWAKCQLDALGVQGMGLGFLFEFGGCGGWVAVRLVFDPAPGVFGFFDFGAGDCKKVFRILAHGDVCHLDVQEVGNVIFYDLQGFLLGVDEFHAVVLTYKSQIFSSSCQHQIAFALPLRSNRTFYRMQAIVCVPLMDANIHPLRANQVQKGIYNKGLQLSYVLKDQNQQRQAIGLGLFENSYFPR